MVNDFQFENICYQNYVGVYFKYIYQVVINRLRMCRNTDIK